MLFLDVLELSRVGEDADIVHLATVVSDGVHKLAFAISKNRHYPGLVFLSHTPSYTAKDPFRQARWEYESYLPCCMTSCAEITCKQVARPRSSNMKKEKGETAGDDSDSHNPLFSTHTSLSEP